MKIVVDSNRVIAALIKEGTTRAILFDKNFEFFAPEHIKDEIEKHQEQIRDKIGITKEEINVLISFIFENIIIVSKSEYENKLKELKEGLRDHNDLPYLAVAIVKDAGGIWTHDTHFKEQKKIKIFTNIDLIKMINEKENKDNPFS